MRGPQERILASNTTALHLVLRPNVLEYRHVQFVHHVKQRLCLTNSTKIKIPEYIMNTNVSYYRHCESCKTMAVSNANRNENVPTDRRIPPTPKLTRIA
jgi:hypothetical protein